LFSHADLLALQISIRLYDYESESARPQEEK
jgi:hypothetical protein